MTTYSLEPRISDELKVAIDRASAAGELMTPDQINQQLALFRDKFSPAVLAKLEGEELLQRMHGRADPDARCLAYWLEFKNDDEFAGHRFGGIGGGQAMKYGLYQRQSDQAWMGGAPNAPRVLSLGEAIEKTRQQRDELLAGDRVLSGINDVDVSDETYARLQTEMNEAAPELSGDGWAHKYWFLLYPDKLDDFHSPRWQRFHLFKVLQMPPDRVGILNASAPRFICAGRFAGAARDLGVPVMTLDTVLNQRNGPLHRYWRVGTTEGSEGESQWSVMRDGGFVSIGWRNEDLSSLIGRDRKEAKDQIRQGLIEAYSYQPSVATRKAGEILNFIDAVAENDIVLAVQGQTVLGVGRVSGPYEYNPDLHFPHKRPVEWALLNPWQMPVTEGPRTAVYELGRVADNLLEIEKRLYQRDPIDSANQRISSGAAAGTVPLQPLDPLAGRIDGILRRKGQVVLYGPPGTGKTYHARRVARELAARRNFGKNISGLSEVERLQIDGDAGLVRLCTFHPGYGYEDFVEGLRPKTINGQMVFEVRNGIFKALCEAADKEPEHAFFLVVDEINRGDVPRIFGELITVIEHDKRKLPITLPVTGLPFAVPTNVFLIGTMNTADRSISLLDAALRRRFGFVELMPDSLQLGGRKVGELPLGVWLDALNARLRKNLKRDARNLQIGHAYLMPVTSAADFTRILRDELIPLLEEYCYDDFGTLRDILNASLIDIESGRVREEMFEPSREAELIQSLYFEEMDITLGATPPDVTNNDEEQGMAIEADALEDEAS
jgi:5-methylcytosine-specific restriction protein B